MDILVNDTEHNRRVALRMLERIAQGVIDDELVTPDVYWWVPGQGDMSRAEFARLVDAFGRLHRGDGRMVVKGVTAEGDRVAVEAESFFDLLDGRVYNNTYHFLFQFRDGRICCAKEYNDSKYAAETLALL
jgi:hypothetical protein